MKPEIILKGGRVIDPAQGLNKMADVAIADGKILSVGEVVDDGSAEIIEVNDFIVTPGLVDIHVHAYGSLGFSHPNTIGIDQGVTSYVEAGGPGPDTFQEYKAVMEGATVADLYCMLWFRSIGLVGVGHIEGDVRSLMSWNLPRWMDLIAEYCDDIKYLKIGAFGDYGVGPLKLGKGLAQTVGLPTYTHIGEFQVTPERITTPDAFDLADANDVITHIYHKNPGSILDDDGKVIPQVIAAKQRGALFDIGFGSFNFAWDVAERALAQDITNDIISSDLQQFNTLGPTYSLTHVMSCFLPLGFTLEEIISRVTIAPAKALSIEDKAGSLKVGMPADITVLNVEEGKFEFDDCFEDTRKSDKRIVPIMAFKHGVRYDSNLASSQEERNWILQVSEDEPPKAAAGMSKTEKIFLKSLVDSLDADQWDHENINLTAATAVQNRVYEVQSANGLPMGDALKSVYRCFLEEPFTYQIGLFLTRMDRAFTLDRLRQVAGG
jgi:dihydroorotase